MSISPKHTTHFFICIGAMNRTDDGQRKGSRRKNSKKRKKEKNEKMSTFYPLLINLNMLPFLCIPLFFYSKQEGKKVMYFFLIERSICGLLDCMDLFFCKNAEAVMHQCVEYLF